MLFRSRSTATAAEAASCVRLLLMVRRYYHLDHDEARRQMARVSMTVSPETNVGPGQLPPYGGPTAAG